MLNLTALLYSSLGLDRFDDRIVPTSAQQTTLERAKNDIRDHLRPRIRAVTVTVLGMSRAVEPKFRSQGSQRYKTCLQPVHLPPQEMDWDYGVYLPVTVWEEKGPPRAMAKLYFDLVEGLLRELCQQRGWKLVQGRDRKDNCVRIQIDSWAHIDIPLYAASEQAFSKITERALLKAASSRFAMDSAMDAANRAGELVEQEWDDLEHVVMATRSGEWKASDPEIVTRWFLDRMEQHGPQLRRVCRYVKAWRDYHWQSGGPTSVSMMIAVAQDFVPQAGRDDKALEHAARLLAQKLSGPIREHGIDQGQEDFNRLDDRGRAEAAALAGQLANQLRDARMQRVGLESQAISFLTGQLGSRIPQRTDLVVPDQSDEHVRTVPARQVTPPVVPPTKAGKAG
ncbi:MAG: CBASS cGAMP synthase [Hylemonella sp.]|uniref:CBASS cGAMP synthase n=1 Tax=Hylemonella sp. TaxID=2066020 RepID=UPI0039191BD1